jgi:hypothetical protein
MKKITIIIISLMVFSILNSYFVSPQTEEDIEIVAEEIEMAEDLSQVYTRGRFFLSLLNLFRGGTCGDNICGEYEFDCLEDCGKFIAKNGFFGGDLYRSLANFEGVDYEFKIIGTCTTRESSSVKESVSKGGIIEDMKVMVDYSGQSETIENIGNNEEFTLGNGKVFFINTFACNSIGFLDVNLAKSEAKCGDNACWGLVKEPECPSDCNGVLHVRFYQDEEKFTPITSNVVYNGYDYTFEVVSTNDYVPNCRVDKTATLSVFYHPINNPSAQSTEEFTLTSPVNNFKLGNGMEFQASMPCSGPYIDKKIYILALKAI